MQPAYALFPFVGFAGATLRGGGVVLTKTSAGSKLISGAGFLIKGGLLAWCVKNSKKCLDMGEDVAEDVIDNHNRKNDDDSDNDEPKNRCKIRFGSSAESAQSLSDLIAEVNSYTKYYGNPGYTFEVTSESIAEYKKREQNLLKKYNALNREINGMLDSHGTMRYKFTHVENQTSSYSEFYAGAYVFCSKSSDDDLADELLERLKDKLSDDDAKDIVNNYYNKTENNFDIEQYCATSNACVDIDNEFAEKLTTKDYDYTKVNKQNCEVKNNKIVSCDNAKKHKSDDDDDSDNTNQDDKKDDKKDDDSDNNDNSDSTNKKDDNSDNQKIKCNSSEFHKKICDFIDWYQDDDLNADDDTKVKVKDLSDDLEIDENRIKFGYSCPSPDSFSFSLFAKTFTYSISYQSMCDSFLKLRPFVIGFSYIVGGMIVLGRKI